MLLVVKIFSVREKIQLQNQVATLKYNNFKTELEMVM